MKKIEQFLFPFSIKNIALFCVTWFCVGFTTGTLLLLYPVHWITGYAEVNNWAESNENLIIKAVIVLFAMVSFLLSVWLLRVFLKMKTLASKLIFFTLLLSLTAFFLWLWMNPDIMNKTSQQKIAPENTKNAEFFFGTYPTESALRDLKEEGYTLVISLLHPAVMPFEPKLIVDEEKAVTKVGIRYIHIPMLPWVSDNQDAINKIKEVIKNEKGKIFVHCYLGKDRVNVVKNIVKNNNGIIEHSAMNEETRKLEDAGKFERGEIIKLEPDVFFIPYPTDEEYFGYILSSPIKQVVSLLNPENADDLVLIEKEKKLLPQYQINYHLMPVLTEPYYPDTILNIVQRLKKIPHPLVIHAFFTNGAVGEAIRLSYTTQKQVLPPALFSVAMKNGTPVAVAPNAVAGNTPLSSEFQNYLYLRGVRNIAFTGDANSSTAKSLQKAAAKAGLEWHNFKSDDPALTEALKTSGTWYIFGSPVEEIQKIFEGKLQGK